MVKTLIKPLKKVFSFPGSILLIPMMISAIVNSFFKDIILIGEPINSIFNGTGVMTLLFIMLFVSGLQLQLKNVKSLLKESFVLIILRVLIVIIIYYIYLHYFSVEGIFNIYAFTLMIALCSTNPGLFIALVGQYGRKESLSLFGPFNILPLPVIPIAIYSLASNTSFSFNSLLPIFIPFILGVLVGNYLPEIKAKFTNFNLIILFFWGFGIGSKINLSIIVNDLLTGVILTLMYYLLILIPMIFLERKLLKSDGLLAISSCSVAAIALIIPNMLNMTNISATIIESSVNQLAIAVILTSLISPLLAKTLKRSH